MSLLPNDDYFESSKMSFGEHLEELRSALIRSLYGLVIGAGIGFAISGYVIKWIEGPLLEALDDYYVNKTKTELTAEFGSLTKEMEQQIETNGRVFENVYFERSELQRILGAPSAEEVSAEPTAPTLDFVPVRIWREVGTRIQSLNAQEPFFAYLKVGVFTGLTLAGPWIFYQLWLFVAEGLYPNEKKHVYIYLPFSIALFVAGASLAFFFVFEPVLAFLFSFNKLMNIDPAPRISDWLGFVLMLPLGFGIGFQLPLVMLFMHRIGIFTVESYLSQWRVAVLVIFVAAMILTPADPTSMLLLALPLTALYFLGVALCKYLPKSESPFGEGYDPGAS